MSFFPHNMIQQTFVGSTLCTFSAWGHGYTSEMESPTMCYFSVLYICFFCVLEAEELCEILLSSGFLKGRRERVSFPLRSINLDETLLSHSISNPSAPPERALYLSSFPDQKCIECSSVAQKVEGRMGATGKRSP